MTFRRMPSRAGLLLGVLACVCACQSIPDAGQTAVTLAAADLPPPLTVAVAVSENSAEGLTVNDWGGEVPRSKPVGGVEEGGLADPS